MNFREKIVMQTVICMMIFTGVQSLSMADMETVNKVESFFTDQIAKNYTASQIKATLSEHLKKISGMQEMVNTAVIRANTDSVAENPLGKPDEQGLQIVYAAGGGNVIDAGISQETGIYVKIKNDEYIYTYGNLAELSVIPGERARKGDVIGTFDSKSKNAFTFEID